jgi:hypothetical protein
VIEIAQAAAVVAFLYCGGWLFNRWLAWGEAKAWRDADTKARQHMRERHGVEQDDPRPEQDSALMMGPGIYDAEAELVAARVGVNDATGGGVIVIVLGGPRGPGFSVHADAATMALLPHLLEQVALQITVEMGARADGS